MAEAGVTLALLRMDTSDSEAARAEVEGSLAHVRAESARAIAHARAEADRDVERTRVELGLVAEQLRFAAARARSAEEARAWTANQLTDRDLQLAALGEAHRMVVGSLPALERRGWNERDRTAGARAPAAIIRGHAIRNARHP